MFVQTPARHEMGRSQRKQENRDTIKTQNKETNIRKILYNYDIYRIIDQQSHGTGRSIIGQQKPINSCASISTFGEFTTQKIHSSHRS